jgi:hypothetical protein
MMMMAKVNGGGQHGPVESQGIVTAALRHCYKRFDAKRAVMASHPSDMAKKQTKPNPKAEPGAPGSEEAGIMNFFEDLAEKSLPKENPPVKKPKD